MRGELFFPFCHATISGVRRDIEKGTVLHAYMGEPHGVILCCRGEIVARIAPTEEALTQGIRSWLAQGHRATASVEWASASSKMGQAYLSFFAAISQAKQVTSDDLYSRDPRAAQALRQFGR